MATSTPYSASLDNEKFLYKLVIQLLIFCQGSHKLLEPHLGAIGAKLRGGANLQELVADLQAVSKTLLHISKQAKQNVEPTDGDAIALQNDYVMERLDELLGGADVPSRFQQQTLLLKQRVRGSHNEQSYKKVIDSAITLLLNIKDYGADEQKGIDLFLSDLSERLDEIGEGVETAGRANRLSIDSRESLNTEINRQVDNLRETTQSAEELHILKMHTGEHLDRLLAQLLDHKRIEDERQQEAQEKIEIMTQKLQDLETETETLRVKLKIEHEKALYDSLTGLPNRLAYNNRAEMELHRWQRYGAPLTLIIWDIDYFKRINDTYGHKAGDKTLALVGQLLLNNCRDTDFVARYGGEEFVMLMPNTEAVQALEMAESTRKMIQDCGFNSNGESINLTISGGISEFKAGDVHDDVFVRADQALYQSKQGGRNRCSLYQSIVAS